MATAQAELTARMADQFGLEIIRFRHWDSLLFGDGEVQKMFTPKSKRIMLGAPKDRMIIGDLIFVPVRAFTTLRAPSQKFERPEHWAGCPIANFPWLTGYCWLSDMPVDRRLIQGIRELVDALPDYEKGWEEQFGEGFFANEPRQTVAALVAFLRRLAPEPSSGSREI